MNKKKEIIWLIIIFAIYLILRLICWSHIQKLEDNDSTGYMHTAVALITNSWNQIDANDTLFYPILIAFFHIIGLNVESAARFTSLFSSIILFFVIYFIGKKFTESKIIFIALILLAFSPFLINFSVSILTGPTYLALVYIGFLILLNFIEKPTLLKGFIMGIVFSFSYLDRTEGIIFIVAIPFVMIFCFVNVWKKDYPVSKFILWVCLFFVGFAIFSVPVIIRVSSQMHSFSINGRTAWMKVLKNPDGKSYDEKIYGLDYSPSEINIYYIQSHPELLNNLKTIEDSHSNFINIVLKFYKQLQGLVEYRLTVILGLSSIVFFGIGLYYLIYRKKLLLAFLVVAFLVILFFPLLIYDAPLLRHLAVSVPLILLVAAFGINVVSIALENYIPKKKLYMQNIIRRGIPIILIGFVLFMSIAKLRVSLLYPSNNKDYNLRDYSEPLRIIKDDILKNNVMNPKVLSRKNYFPYLAGIERLVIPYAEYEKLITFCKINGANYLFLNYKHLDKFPFISEFSRNDLKDFKILYSKKYADSNKLELYKFMPQVE